MGANLTIPGSTALAGYAGMAGRLRGRMTPGAIILAVDVFAVVIGLGAVHVAGVMTGGNPLPLHAPAVPLVSPISTDDRAAAALAPTPRLRPVVDAVALAAVPDAAVMFAPAVVTDAAYRGGSDFTPPVATAAAAPVAPVVTADPVAPEQSSPPVAKLADIALRGHALAEDAVVRVASDGSLDAMLLGRGGVSATASAGGLSVGLGAPGDATAPVVADVQLASVGGATLGATGLNASVAANVGAPVAAVTHTVGSVVGKVAGLLN